MSKHSWFVVASVALFLHGGCCLLQSDRIREQEKALPRLTCNELLRNGPGGHPFVKLTDVRLCSRGHVFERDMDAAMRLYVPIYSARLNEEPQPRDLALLLEVLDDRDRERLLQTRDIGDLTIELWTGADQLEPWAEQGLTQKYPGLQVANCRVVTVGLHEPTAMKADRGYWYGILSLVVAAGLLAWWVWRRPVLNGGPQQPQTMVPSVG